MKLAPLARKLGFRRPAQILPAHAPAQFRLCRPKDLDLVFDGVLLADVHSRDSDDKTHWTEVRIYRTTTGKYVTEHVGRTVVPGEEDRVDVRVHEHPSQIVKAFRRYGPGGRAFLTRLTLRAFDQATAADQSLSSTLFQEP